MWTFERRARARGFLAVAGVDEAGRGPLAGPVVSAAVILPPDFPVDGVNDSKKLDEKRREKLFDEIRRHAFAAAVGRVDVDEIERINILQAALKSMALAVDRLARAADFLLVDGNRPVPHGCPQETVVGGDGLSVSIAAASIVAKVTRDRMMAEYDARYPDYGFARHKGYGTAVHREAIRRFGPCPIHRRTFRGVREFC
ncbi:MAG: ribonuclease HII [Desulfococcaceae bacterium]